MNFFLSCLNQFYLTYFTQQNCNSVFEGDEAEKNRRGETSKEVDLIKIDKPTIII